MLENNAWWITRKRKLTNFGEWRCLQALGGLNP